MPISTYHISMMSPELLPDMSLLSCMAFSEIISGWWRSKRTFSNARITFSCNSFDLILHQVATCSASCWSCDASGCQAWSHFDTCNLIALLLSEPFQPESNNVNIAMYTFVIFHFSDLEISKSTCAFTSLKSWHNALPNQSVALVGAS